MRFYLNKSENCGACTIVGCALMVITIASIFFKWMKNFWIELGQSFEAFGNAAGSTLWMLWNVLQVVTLAATTIAVLAGAIYFTVKYFEMVRRATDLQKWVEAKLAENETRIGTKLRREVGALENEVTRLELRLNEALAEPEIAPTTTALLVAPSSPLVTTDADEEDTAASEIEPDDDTEVAQQSEPILMSNPF